MLFSKRQAVDFFKALREVSVDFLIGNGLPVDQGRKKYATWRRGYPVGVTQHFTAGVGWRGTVRWLNDGPKENSVSCQMLILDRMLPDYKNLVSKYPELKDLQVTTLLLSEGIIPCWHAGWVNKLTFGIENRNVGMLRNDEGRWCWWADNWNATFPETTLGKTPVICYGKWWEPYTYGQICANILVCQMLYSRFPKMDPRWFLPHSATSGRKTDTGPLFPLHRVRDAVFDGTPIKEIGWLKSFDADPKQMADYVEEEDETFLAEAFKQGDRMGTLEDPDFQDNVPEADLQLLVEEGDWRKELPAIRRALNLLGYKVPASDSWEMDKDTALAVWIFQKSQRMVQDRIPGSQTQAALRRRLENFRLHRMGAFDADSSA